MKPQETNAKSSRFNKLSSRLALAGVLVALGVVASAFNLPVGIAKCFPVQHLINVLAAVWLGPAYAVGMAFSTSLIRNLLGTGSLLAFPGSMIGALLAGLLYRRFGNKAAALAGELLGTGLIGALLAYPLAYYIIGNSHAALLSFVLPFALSSLGGALLAAALLVTLEKSGAVKHVQTSKRI